MPIDKGPEDRSKSKGGIPLSPEGVEMLRRYAGEGVPVQPKPISEVIEEAQKDEAARLRRMAIEERKQVPKVDEHSQNPVTSFLLNYGQIKKVWPQFVACCLAIGILEWFILGQIYSGEIRAKDATIQTLSLRPESMPNQDQEWAPLTESQISEWVTTLEGSGLKTLVVYWGPEVGARRFFLSLKQVGKRLRIDVKAGLGNADGPEIEIVAPDNEPARPAVEQLFKKLLSGTGYPIKTVHFQNPTKQPPAGEVSVFIGEKI